MANMPDGVDWQADGEMGTILAVRRVADGSAVFCTCDRATMETQQFPALHISAEAVMSLLMFLAGQSGPAN